MFHSNNRSMNKQCPRYSLGQHQNRPWLVGQFVRMSDSLHVGTAGVLSILYIDPLVCFGNLRSGPIEYYPFFPGGFRSSFGAIRVSLLLSSTDSFHQHRQKDASVVHLRSVTVAKHLQNVSCYITSWCPNRGWRWSAKREIKLVNIHPVNNY